MKNNSYIILIVLFLFSTSLNAEYKFFEVSSQQGLSQSEVYCFMKDSRGFMWIGTYDGLNLFDGYQIKNFNIENNKYSLSHNTVRCLAEDNNKRVWIGTDDGLCYYSLSEEKMYKLDIIKNKNSFFQILNLEIADNILWIAGTHGLHMLDLEKESVSDLEQSITKTFENQEYGKHCFDILYSSDEKYYFLSDIGIFTFKYNKNKRNFKFGKVHKTIEYKFFTHIKEDKNGNLWLLCSSANEGVYCYNRGENKITKFDTTNGFSSNSVSSLAVDNNNTVWVGTSDMGVNQIKQKHNETYEISHIKHSYESFTISSNQIYSVYSSNDNMVWIGTIGRGLNFCSILPAKFNHSAMYSNQIGYNQNFVRAMDYLDDNNLLLGFQNNGLYRYSLKEDSYTKLGFGHESVFKIIGFKPNKFIICTSLGAYIYDTKKKSTIKINKVDNSVFDAVKISDEVFYLTGFAGLYRLSCNRDQIIDVTKYSADTISSLRTNVSHSVSLHYEKYSNELWLGTHGGGINIFKLDKDFSPKSIMILQNNAKKNSISNNYIRCFAQNNKDTIWVGTFNGLNRIIRDRDEFIVDCIYKEDGLPNNMIQIIQIDSQNKLWLGTNYGLCKYDLLNNEIISYTIDDGLSSNEFSLHTSYIDMDDKCYMGTTHGITYFKTDQVITNTPKLKTYITNIEINNKSIKNKGNNKGSLSKSITETTEISLNSSENNIALDFTSINYGFSDKLKYAYKLDGYKQDWIVVSSNNRSATFSNLKFGRYKFRVKTLNEDGIWGDETTVKINIKTPYYLAWHAFLFYCIFIILVILFITRYSIIKITTKKNIILEAEHNKKLHELDSFRTRFFINISHDLRTPLTLISAHIKQILLKPELPEDIKHELKVVSKNSYKLNHLIEQLLDYRMVEVGKIKLKNSTIELVHFIKEQVSHFDFIIKQKEIDLILNFNKEECWISADSEKLAKILFNILSNAIKYTNKGYIEITTSIDIYDHKEFFCIKVSDSGIGMNEETQSKIFDRFFDSNNNSASSSYGIGLSHCKDLIDVMGGDIIVNSEIDNGSTFSIIIPYISADHSLGNIIKEIQSTEIALPQSNKRHKILIVDDNNDMVELLKSILSANYDLEIAYDGEDGIKIANKTQPDLILTDLVMPKIDGFELCSTIKSNIDTSHIPVIILTSTVGIQMQVKGLKLGADDYIPKPFEVDYLLAKINNLLYRKDKFKEEFTDNIKLNPKKIELTSLDSQFIEKLLIMIEEAIPDSLFSVEEFEKRLGMSHAKFYTKVKNLTGMSTKELLQDFRLKRAAQLIKDSDFNISEIAYQVGFSDPKYFGICFKNKYNYSPTEYRNKSKHSEI